MQSFMSKFNNKKFLFGFSILYVGAVIIALFFIQNFRKADEYHVHAGVRIYSDGELLDFSGGEYMHIEPCSIDEEEIGKELLVQDMVHLHSNIGDVLHIHSEAAQWRHVLEYLRIQNQEPNLSKVYVNGNLENSSEFMNRKIFNEESVVIVLGDPELLVEDEILSNAVQKNIIIEYGELSESCGN